MQQKQCRKKWCFSEMNKENRHTQNAIKRLTSVLKSSFVSLCTTYFMCTCIHAHHKLATRFLSACMHSSSVLHRLYTHILHSTSQTINKSELSTKEMEMEMKIGTMQYPRQVWCKLSKWVIVSMHAECKKKRLRAKKRASDTKTLFWTFVTLAFMFLLQWTSLTVPTRSIYVKN